MTFLPPPSEASLRLKLGQLLSVRIGSNLPPAITVDDDAQRVESLLARCPVGGLVLFNGRAATTPGTLARLQELSEFPMLVASDIERGCGQQMHGLTVFPHAMAFQQLAQGAELDLVRQFGEYTAREARQAGIQVCLSPVCDTATEPRNPIIATRAFGTDPTEVASLAAAFVEGCETAGVATTAKHFPGHGDTRQDSHDSLPQVDRSRESLLATEIPPFAAAIAAGCSLVMTAHVAYPELDASGLPATLSAPILIDLLRGQLGFRGVVCSDSLLMAGVRDRFGSEGELAIAALNAGVDWLLDVADPEGVLETLERGVEAGEVNVARVDEAYERMRQLKLRLFPTGRAESVGSATPDTAAAQLAMEVARRAIEVEPKGTSPALDPSRPVTLILARPFTTPFDPPEQALAGALRARCRELAYFELTPETSEEQMKAAELAAEASSQLVLAMVVKPAAWHRFGLTPAQEDLFDRLTGRSSVRLVSLGVPTILARFPQAARRLCSYSDVPLSQQAVADLLLP
jgi:beta-N-acetylhexosaminidase